MMQITYQKKDGSIIQRLRNTTPPYKIGEITSMGWKLLNIEYKYKDQYYPEYKYNMLIQKDKDRYIKKKRAKALFSKEMRIFIHYLIALIILRSLT